MSCVTPVFLSGEALSSECTSRDIKLINGLWPLKSLAGFSDSPAMYGFRLVPVELVGSVFLGSGLGFISLPRHAVPLTAVFVLFTHELDM